MEPQLPGAIHKLRPLRRRTLDDMSAYRDSLSPEQRERYDKACHNAAIIVGRARSRRDSLPTEEAAREAYIPGGPSVEEIAELIQAQRERARARLVAGEGA